MSEFTWNTTFPVCWSPILRQKKQRVCCFLATIIHLGVLGKLLQQNKRKKEPVIIYGFKEKWTFLYYLELAVASCTFEHAAWFVLGLLGGRPRPRFGVATALSVLSSIGRFNVCLTPEQDAKNYKKFNWFIPKLNQRLKRKLNARFGSNSEVVPGTVVIFVKHGFKKLVCSLVNNVDKNVSISTSTIKQ